MIEHRTSHDNRSEVPAETSGRFIPRAAQIVGTLPLLITVGLAGDISLRFLRTADPSIMLIGAGVGLGVTAIGAMLWSGYWLLLLALQITVFITVYSARRCMSVSPAIL